MSVQAEQQTERLGAWPLKNAPPARERLNFAARLLLSCVFLFAVAGKLLDFPEFLRSVAALSWLPEEYASIAGISLLIFETLAAVLLLLKASHRLGALLSAALATLFCYVTGSLLIQGVEGDCSCFGVFLRLPRPATLLVDVALLAASLYLLRCRNALPVQTTPRYLLPLSAAFVFLSLMLLVLVRTNTDLRLHFAALLPDVQSGLARYRPEADPKVGSTAPRASFLTPQDQWIDLSAWKGRPTVLLFVGHCGNCAVRRVDTWSKLPRGDGRTLSPRLVAVTTDSVSEARRLARKVEGKATVVRDNHRITTEAFNAVWTPRAYLIAANGTLLYCQPRPHDLVRAMSAVEAELRKGGEDSRP